MEVYGRSLTLPRAGLAARFAAATVCAALTGVSAHIAFHLWYTPVPITLQVLVVILSGLMLGRRWGAFSQIQYLAMGLMGMPVFAGGIAGPAAFAGPRGGYLLGFVAGAYLAGLVFEKLRERTSAASWIAGAAGISGIYLCGASWLAVWIGLATGKGLQSCLHDAWVMGIAPFIGVDIIKSAIAAGIAKSRSS